MKCPNCGNELPEDKLYCEVCGAEIRIVPDIDVEIEHHMRHMLSNLDMEADDDYEDDDFDLDDPSILGMLLNNRHKFGKAIYLLFAVILILVVIVAIRIGVKVSRENSFEYQMELANKAIAENNISNAIIYLEKAVKLDEENVELIFQISEYYASLGKTNDAIYSLIGVAEDSSFAKADREEAYRIIVSLYRENSDFVSINSLLDRCDLPSIVKEFESYRVDSVFFNLDGGTYTETISVSLSTLSDTTIYYTLDGTDPTIGSTVYDAPIFLEYGSYTISAMTVNDYGIESEVVRQTYLIDVDFSFAPEVVPESGVYDHGILIEIDMPQLYTAYYTEDGTEPTKESSRYFKPFSITDGEHNMKFVCFASDGTPSEIIERNYNITLNTELTAAQAVENLVQGLVDRGYLDYTSGLKESEHGWYQYIYFAVRPIENMGDFYIVREYFKDEFENITITDNLYAIDCYNSVLYSVEVTEDDQFILSPL